MCLISKQIGAFLGTGAIYINTFQNVFNWNASSCIFKLMDFETCFGAERRQRNSLTPDSG